jgi:hypothetical protein
VAVLDIPETISSLDVPILERRPTGVDVLVAPIGV